MYAYIYIYTHIHTYYIHSQKGGSERGSRDPSPLPSGVSTGLDVGRTANLCTNIMDFRGFDSSIILILRGGVLMSIGDFSGSLSQAILVGIMLVGRLSVWKRDITIFSNFDL